MASAATTPRNQKRRSAPGDDVKESHPLNASSSDGIHPDSSIALERYLTELLNEEDPVLQHALEPHCEIYKPSLVLEELEEKEAKQLRKQRRDLERRFAHWRAVLPVKPVDTNTCKFEEVYQTVKASVQDLLLSLAKTNPVQASITEKKPWLKPRPAPRPILDQERHGASERVENIDSLSSEEKTLIQALRKRPASAPSASSSVQALEPNRKLLSSQKQRSMDYFLVTIGIVQYVDSVERSIQDANQFGPIENGLPPLTPCTDADWDACGISHSIVRAVFSESRIREVEWSCEQLIQQIRERLPRRVIVFATRRRHPRKNEVVCILHFGFVPIPLKDADAMEMDETSRRNNVDDLDASEQRNYVTHRPSRSQVILTKLREMRPLYIYTSFKKENGKTTEDAKFKLPKLAYLHNDRFALLFIQTILAKCIPHTGIAHSEMVHSEQAYKQTGAQPTWMFKLTEACSKDAIVPHMLSVLLAHPAVDAEAALSLDGIRFSNLFDVSVGRLCILRATQKVMTKFGRVHDVHIEQMTRWMCWGGIVNPITSKGLQRMTAYIQSASFQNTIEFLCSAARRAETAPLITPAARFAAGMEIENGTAFVRTIRKTNAELAELTKQYISRIPALPESVLNIPSVGIQSWINSVHNYSKYDRLTPETRTHLVWGIAMQALRALDRPHVPVQQSQSSHAVIDYDWDSMELV